MEGQIVVPHLLGKINEMTFRNSLFSLLRVEMGVNTCEACIFSADFKTGVNARI